MTFQKNSISNLTYDANHNFYKYYCDNKKIDSNSLKSQYSFLDEFLNDVDKFSDLKPRNENTKNKQSKMYDTASELYNKFIDKYFDENFDLEKEKKEELDFKLKAINLKIKEYGYGKFYNEISDHDFDEYDDYKEEEFIDYQTCH